jgi:hypothetical protein
MSFDPEQTQGSLQGSLRYKNGGNTRDLQVSGILHWNYLPGICSKFCHESLAMSY